MVLENSISSRGTSQYKHPETEAAFKEQPKAAGGEEENRIGTPDAGGGGHKDKVDGKAL